MAAKSGTERTTAWRNQLVADGYKQKSFLLSPAAQAALKALARGSTERDVVEALLTEAAKRRR